MQPGRAQNDPLSFALLTLTGVTGLVDAVSFLGLGHVFTANMTGNVVLLAFAVAGTPGDSPWPGHRLPWWHSWSAQRSAVASRWQWPPPVDAAGSSQSHCPKPCCSLPQRSPRSGSISAL